jgi:putative flippase GtrA
MTKNQTTKQGIKFAIVGAIGLIINGAVFALLNPHPIGQIIPLPFPFLEQINLAWWLGILTSTINNFVLDKFWVFSNR